MPRASRHQLNKEQIKGLSEQFSYLISSLSSGQDIENFFTEFLTPEEKTMLTKRLMLFIMLQRGFPPGAIQQSLTMSHETVRIYQHHFSSKSRVFVKILDQLARREKTKELLKRIQKSLKPLGYFLRAKTDMRARASIGNNGWS